MYVGVSYFSVEQLTPLNYYSLEIVISLLVMMASIMNLPFLMISGSQESIETLSLCIELTRPLDTLGALGGASGNTAQERHVHAYIHVRGHLEGANLQLESIITAVIQK